MVVGPWLSDGSKVGMVVGTSVGTVVAVLVVVSGLQTLLHPPQ